MGKPMWGWGGGGGVVAPETERKKIEKLSKTKLTRK